MNKKLKTKEDEANAEKMRRKSQMSFTLLLPDRDHKMDSDKLGHVQTWEFLCDNTVHTEKFDITIYIQLYI